MACKPRWMSSAAHPIFKWILRASRPVTFREHYTLVPFIEFFNLFNRNNPGANYVTNLAALAKSGEQLDECNRDLPECELQSIAADYQLEPTACPRRRVG